MRIAVPLLALIVAVPVFAQEAPKQNPFAFEMPKKAAEPEKPKAEPKPDKKSEPKSEAKAETKSEPKSEPQNVAPAATTPDAPEVQPVAAATAASATTTTTETGSEPIAAQPEAASPQTPAAAPVAGATAAVPVAATKPAKAPNPDPLNFRLPNTEQAPSKGNPAERKPNPFTFELPQPKQDAAPQS